MKKFNKYYVLFLILAAIYLILTFAIPPDASVLTRYSLTANEARALSLTVVLPVIGIWFVAFYGFVQFQKYADVISDTKDGKHLMKLSRGLMYLAISLPITSILSTALNYIAATRQDLTAKTVIVTNYVTLLFFLVAFYAIYIGAAGLYATVKKKTAPYSIGELLIGFVFVIFSTLYMYAALTSPIRRVPNAAAAKATYYLSDPLLVVTILIPYLFVWFFGIGAAYYIQQYRLRVKGTIYRQSLGYLSSGLLAVIISLIVIRFLNSWASHLGSLSLKILLFVLYLLLLLIAVGYGLIAIGAKKLKKIEEV